MSVLTNPQDAHFWIFIALLVFIAILWRAKVPGLAAKHLDAAGAKVQGQLDEAARLRGEAEQLLAEIKVQRARTDTLAGEMLAAARTDAERLRAEAALTLEADIERRGALAERKIATAEAQAAADVKAAAADLAARAAETVLAARIAGAKTDPLIDAGLARLGERFQ
ncbi:MAG: ATP F0F1 synthase subunit B [Caulobacteraceae bacterium]